ncbi:uncharacterized protein [Antedon mediterranea]|uniref:uncharacterized protein n=1 Tax=Antedon mediterranea TaxID=105859 RepID=UPI003AF71F7B
MEKIESIFPPLSGIHPSMTSEATFWEDDPTMSKRMELLLNSSLCVISNLSKSRKNRELFRTSEWRKILDIFKGSPSKWRCLYSLIAISYIADPIIDVELLEDKHGVINEITSVLDNTLSGKSTGFSVQELVEALVNLAVHPLNKDQIIDKSLTFLYAIMERNDKSRLRLYVRQVLDEWGFSDVDDSSSSDVIEHDRRFSDVECTSSSDVVEHDRQTENEITMKSEKCLDNESQCLDNIQMLDNLYCVLLQCDSFESDDVIEIVTAVRQMISKEDRRQTILKHMNEHGWPDILIRIINDVWKANTETVYTDELQWTIIKTSIEIIVTYSDCDPEVLIEHGALNLMHTITDAYYQHFKQKLLYLDEKTSEYRGQITKKVSEVDKSVTTTMTEGKSVDSKQEETKLGIASNIDVGSHSHFSKENVPQSEEMSIQKAEVLSSRDRKDECGHTTNVTTSRELKTNNTTSEQEQTASIPYTLKPVREHGDVNSDRTIAYRINSGVMYNRAVFVSNQPIQTSRLFELKIDKVDDSHNSSMEFGVCIYNSFPDDIFYEGNGYGKGSGFWFLRDDDLWRDFQTIGGGYKLNLRNIQVDDKVGFVLHRDGTLAFLYNGKYQGIAFRNIPGGVYALVATSGKCVQVSITENVGKILQQKSPDSTVDEPFESFSVKTVGNNPVSVSRMRAPYGFDFVNEDTHPKMKEVYNKPDDSINEFYVKTEQALNPLFEINQRSRKGYLNEKDLRTLIGFSVNLYKTHNNPATRVDPISNDHMRFITTSVELQSKLIVLFQKNKQLPDNTNTLPKRFQQVFDLVRPCFDNIKDMSGIVWTGSTSEGFAIADNSGPGMSYVDDEMDLMIPLAIAAEDPHHTTPCEDFKIVDEMSSRIMKEEKDVNKECFITELEDIGKRQQRQECPTFTWRPSVHPGYVTISIPDSLQSYTSLGFTKHLCARFLNGKILLTRSKLLGIQEEYTRRRLNAVQSEITKNENENEKDEFKGKLRLVQEGPVQTISVCYESKEPGGSVLEFDQTVDVAIALNGVNWPTIANPWISRKREWPKKTIVEKIITDGYHLVPKYYPAGKGIDLEWRLSFSMAERTLAHTFTENQRKCYMVFKKLWRKCFKEPKVLSSYHIKTTMFWLCERTSPTDWIDSNLGDRFLDLQNFLIQFLQKENLPNYFIPENNMISNIDAEDVKVILAKVQNVRRHQAFYLKDLVAPISFFNFN